MARYALHPGKVTLRASGEIVELSALDLAQRYGVDMADSIVWDDERRTTDRYSDYVHLFPKASGDYTLPGIG